MTIAVVRIARSCCLALTLGACATANTPQQELAYTRWERCRTPYTQLEDVALDGRISFMVTSGAERDGVLGCLAEAGRTGPPLPAPRTVRPPGGP